MSGSWRVALRLALRDVSANPRRTALTAALIGLPVLFAAVFTAFGLGADDLLFGIMFYLPLMLLIVLLAIPAFGVTARSRRDQLDLLESTGGTATDARRTITAVGAVIGAVGVVGGLVLAVPGWIALVALVNHYDDGQNTVLSISDLALWPLLALMSLAASVAAAAITAATLPAQSDGSDDPPSRTWLGVGVGLAVLGVFGILSIRGDSGAIAPWTTLLGVGVVLIVPSLVHLVGRFATALPLPARLSARDAARHRSRTAPAIAAVMAGVAAVTALGIGSFSDNLDRRTETQMYQFPVGAVQVYADSDAAMVEAVAAGAADGIHIVPMGTPADDEYVSIEFPADVDDMAVNSGRFDLVIADADTLEGWGVALSPDAEAALTAGRALAGPTVALRGDEVRATLESVDEKEPARTLVIPAMSTDLAQEPVPAGLRSQLARIVIPPALAETLGITSVARIGVVDRRGPAPTAEQVSDIRGVPGVAADVQKRPHDQSYRLIFILLTLLGVGIVGLATATAVALARVDGREDADTLVSVGARPSTARWSAAAAALLISGLGSILGVAVGLLPGLRAASALTGGFGERFLAIPWALLATVGIGVPVIVAIIAFVTTPVRPGDPSPSLR